MTKIQNYNSTEDISMQIYFKKDPELASSPHFHDSLEFIFVLEGKTEANLDEKCETLEAGDIFFSESYETHSYQVLTEKFSAYVLVVASEYVRSFRELYPDLTLPTYLTDKEKNRRIFDLMDNWYDEKQKTTLSNMGYVSLVLARMIDSYPLIKRNEYKGDVLLKELLRYIHSHYLENITLKSVAHEFGYSVEYCSKLLGHAINCNFREYINILRLRKAKELMNDKSLNMSQSEILYACGFTNPATYYRVKKQLMDSRSENAKKA